MIEILINGQVAAICLPELVQLFVSALVPNIGLEYKIETRKHEEKKEESK